MPVQLTTRTTSISIDLDPLRCYFGIHGLGRVPDELQHVVFERAVPRFAEIFARRRIAASFFVVGADLATADSARAVGELARAGHEIGNHSQTHPYELARLSEQRIDEEIGRAEQLILDVTGRRPSGFRAPGYDMSARVLRVLERRAYRYDSSVFGSWSYYVAKAGVMAALGLVGRGSRAVLIDPRALLAPTRPYRASSSPFAKGQSPVVELPISVSPGWRVPLIGTSLLAAPEAMRRRLVSAALGQTFFNFELHGLDLLDAEQDGLPRALVDRQPDLRVPLSEKLRAFEGLLDRLADGGRFVTLDEAAIEVQRDGFVGA